MDLILLAGTVLFAANDVTFREYQMETLMLLGVIVNKSKVNPLKTIFLSEKYRKGVI